MEPCGSMCIDLFLFDTYIYIFILVLLCFNSIHKSLWKEERTGFIPNQRRQGYVRFSSPWLIIVHYAHTEVNVATWWQETSFIETTNHDFSYNFKTKINKWESAKVFHKFDWKNTGLNREISNNIYNNIFSL